MELNELFEQLRERFTQKEEEIKSMNLLIESQKSQIAQLTLDKNVLNSQLSEAIGKWNKAIKLFGKVEQ